MKKLFCNLLIVFALLQLFPIVGYAQHDTLIQASISNHYTPVVEIAPMDCMLYGHKLFEVDQKVFIAGTEQCNSRWKMKRLFKVASSGAIYYVDESSLVVDSNAYDYVNSLDSQAKKNFELAAISASVNAALAEVETRTKLLNKILARGVQIVSYAIYDESEYTDGTSFSVTILNPTKKGVKYVYLNLVGLNPVNDPVRGKGSSINPTVTCVGPILAGSKSSFEFPYVWMSDLVETVKIKSVKIVYMDNTTKIVSVPSTIIVSTAEKEALGVNSHE